MSDMTTMEASGLIRLLDNCVRQRELDAITSRIKNVLSEAFRTGSLKLPDHLCRPRDDCYARRLLHRDEQLGYTAVVMTWGPGQSTPLHDHAGIWCVEGVVEGEMNVTRFDVLEQQGTRYRFRKVEQIHAGVGSTGSLIPPYEYHVLANALPDRPSITLHVYGGEMNSCSIYQPRRDGWYDRIEKTLSYAD